MAMAGNGAKVCNSENKNIKNVTELYKKKKKKENPLVEHLKKTKN